MTTLKNNALIFKANNDGDCDPYREELGKIGIICHTLPVLCFDFVNLDELLEALKSPDAFSGIVVTSPRTVEAIMQCIGEDRRILLSSWQRHRIFVVGKSSAKCVEDMLSLPTIGEESGNAESLVNKILEVIPPNSKPLLFPCSNLKRETVPKMLKDAGVMLKSITVYETKPNPDIKEEICRFIANGVPEFFIFFSPSGVNFTRPAMESLGIQYYNVQYVAIGPTTEEALIKAYRSVFAVAKQPTAVSLAEAIWDKIGILKAAKNHFDSRLGELDENEGSSPSYHC